MDNLTGELYAYDIVINDGKQVRCVVSGSENTMARANAEIRRMEAYYLYVGYGDTRIHSKLWKVCYDCGGAGSRPRKNSKWSTIVCKTCKSSGRMGDYIPIDWTPASDYEYKNLAHTCITGGLLWEVKL